MEDPRRLFQHAEEAVARRYQAASWLQRMIGPLDLPIDPSEEDLRLSLRDGNVLCRLINKVDPGLLSKVQDVGDPNQNSMLSRGNLRKFLGAAAEIKINVFEVSDLEQPNYQPSSSELVVDCILLLKAYYEQLQSKDSGLNDRNANFYGTSRASIKESSASPSNASLKPYSSPSTVQKSPSQPRKRWVIPEFDNAAEADTVLSQNTDFSLRPIGEYPENASILHRLNGWKSSLTDENFVPSLTQSGTGLTSTHIHHISQKFREILRLKTRGAMQDFVTTENSGVFGNLDNSSSQSLSSLVNAILGDKQQDEVPALVEFMLKKVMEEFERRLVTQSEQVVKLKNTLKEHLTREDRLASRARVLETLAAGTGEEVKIVSNQLQKMKMEKKLAEEDTKVKEALMKNLLSEREEHQTMLESLERELQVVKQQDQEHIIQLEFQKKELEHEMQEKLNRLEFLQGESERKMQELKAISAAEMLTLRKKDEKYEAFIVSQVQSLQDIKLALQRTRQDFVHMQYAWQEELETLVSQLQEIAQAASGYHKVLAENRQLYNEVQDLKGNIRVYCRVRPFLPDQVAGQSSVEFAGENGDIMITNPMKQGKDGHKMFTFNKVFGPSTTQEEVFMDTRPLIRSVLDGYNVCIFAYGQTGSGKTFTMSGPSTLSERDWGVNYRALNDLFQISQDREDVFKYEVGVQMVEIYNEQVRDLLLADGPNKKLEIRFHSQLNGLNVPDACMLPVTSTSDVVELIKIGQKNRAVGATALNKRSSRSHSVLTVHVQGTDLASGSILRGCLHLVDLAGSERVDRSEATGDRLKEAQHINKSLSALGDVVSALAQKNAHVPYRNSKLTQLLQDSLGGQAKTLMFVHISPDVESYGETISTLKFAERVASVELGAARSNKESREIRDLKDQVMMLKEVLAKKDGEIERLQMLRNVGNEALVGSDKSKPKIASGIPLYKPTVEIQQHKPRRQTVDMAGLKELQKTTTPQPFQGSRSQDFEIPSLPTSPKISNKLHDGALKDLEKRVGKGSELDKLQDGALKGLEKKRAGKSKELDNRALNNDAYMKQSSGMERHDLWVKAEAMPKEWQDRLQSSTDSSFSGTSSVDDVYDGNQAQRNDLTSSLPHSEAGSLHVESGMDGKDKGWQTIEVHESLLSDSSRLRPKETEGRVIPNSSNGVRIKPPVESPDLDAGSDISDGDASQAETELSLPCMLEQVSSVRKERIKSTKATPNHRKPPLSQISRSSRGEWKSMNLGHSRSHVRRHTMVVSPGLSLEHASIKRQPVVGTKHAMAMDASSSSDTNGKLGSQGGAKAAKRWL